MIIENRKKHVLHQLYILIKYKIVISLQKVKVSKFKIKVEYQNFDNIIGALHGLSYI